MIVSVTITIVIPPSYFRQQNHSLSSQKAPVRNEAGLSLLFHRLDSLSLEVSAAKRSDLRFHNVTDTFTSDIMMNYCPAVSLTQKKTVVYSFFFALQAVSLEG